VDMNKLKAKLNQFTQDHQPTSIIGGGNVFWARWDQPAIPGVPVNATSATSSVLQPFTNNMMIYIHDSKLSNSKSKVRYFCQYMFETPKPPQLTIAVSTDSLPFEKNQSGKLQLLSPEETIMAFILAVHRDLSNVATAQAQLSSIFMHKQFASWAI
jgi:hypothetical protein